MRTEILTKNNFIDSAFSLIARRIRSENVDLQFAGWTCSELKFILIAHLDRTGRIRVDVLEEKGR